MIRKLRNVTITLDEETAGWARVEAARRDVSLSRFIAEMIQEQMHGAEEYEQAWRRYFRQDAGIHRRPGQKLPSREELYDRDRLR
jgi:hypothetical protein